MQYDSVWDKQHEECGVFGIYDRQLDIPRYVYWGLFALQHRGQESSGMSLADGEWMATFRGMGLVSEVFQNNLPDMKCHMGIGHVRYSTTGSNNPNNIQPLSVYSAKGQIAMAHNGNLTNTVALRKQLDEEGAIFQTTMDSEVIVNMIARSKKETIEEQVVDTITKLEGSFSLVVMTKDQLIGVRDPFGFRPLCLGKTKTGGWVIASETCALDAVDALFVRDIQPGEMVIVDDAGVRSVSYSVDKKKALCVFEYIYFARPDSVIDGQDVYQARLAMGRELARETQYEADLVISVPDSGTTAAIGYAQESGIPYDQGLIKNRYMGRTFIQPDQEQRKLAVRMKLNAVKSVVKGKRIVMIDDSIVRGTTSGIIANMLREAGAKEVYMCVCAPPIEYPCFYGIDTSVRKELIAATHSLEEIRQFIGVEKLHYLSIDGLCRAVEGIPKCHMCLACFNNAYPTTVPKANEKGEKYALEGK